ncbi:hypothetical protein H8E77_00525 [bacterium]|nr:hypothetical protein [bacterium]
MLIKDVINLTTSYIYDTDLRLEANRQGKNYWYEYIKEVNEQLGLRAEEMSRNLLEDVEVLCEVSILFIEDLTEAQMTDKMKSNLDEWVKSGGVLIGFGTEGLDEIFGNSCDSITSQPESDYTISGYFDLKPDTLTTDVHSYLHPEQKLIIFSNIRNISPENSTEIARLYGVDGRDTGYSAITKRDYHNGHAYYFAFNVPQTIWVLHQGIPITSDRDGDGYYRTGDLIAIGNNEREVLYADEILFLIQNMLAQKPQPLIYQMPPKNNPLAPFSKGDNQIPDALFYWGGDDEAAAGTQVWASNWMKVKGLPYHINIMPNKEGKFAMTAEEAQAVIANGHECSLHYNFWDNFNHPCGFTESDVRAQAEAFYETFGFRHVCSVNHCLRWSGWVEPAKWMRAVGSRADNSFVHHPLPPMNPANRLGFVFGTSYPFYFYDNYLCENKKIDFLEEPITAYEVGYSLPTPGPSQEGCLSETTDFDLVHKVIDMAAQYHLTMDMFYHPINIYRSTACREAIEEVVRYIESKEIIAVHKGNDGLWEWWDKRSRSQIIDVTIAQSGTAPTLSFTACCESEEGMIVKIPINASVDSVICDDQNASFKSRFEFGKNWLYVVVPEGRHKITISSR